MNRQDVSVTLPWMGAGTELLVRAVSALPDDALAEPSRLPGWTRAHVVGHLARNAEALTRLATWARTGVETPMYADREQRAADIEESAQAPVDTLRRELVETAATLDAALAALDERTWQAPVRSAVGRPIPAAEVPWMRVREVWLHAVDLDAGVEPGRPAAGGRGRPARRRHRHAVGQGGLPGGAAGADRPGARAGRSGPDGDAVPVRGRGGRPAGLADRPHRRPSGSTRRRRMPTPPPWL